MHSLAKLLQIDGRVGCVAFSDLRLFLVEVVLHRVERPLHVVYLACEIVGPRPHELLPGVLHVAGLVGKLIRLAKFALCLVFYLRQLFLSVEVGTDEGRFLADGFSSLSELVDWTLGEYRVSICWL